MVIGAAGKIVAHPPVDVEDLGKQLVGNTDPSVFDLGHGRVVHRRFVFFLEFRFER